MSWPSDLCVHQAKKSMKFLFTAFISVLLASMATFLLVHVHLTGLFPWEKNDDEGVVTVSLPSEILKETREVVITRPRNYSPQKEYPVLYVLDGSSAHVRDAALALEVLAANGYAPETIVVGIPNPSMEARQRDLTPPYMLTDNDDTTSALGGGDMFLEFMQQELIPWVDSHYSTSACRLISGSSRGGLLELHSLITKPDLFHARFCYSTPFWRQDEVVLKKFDEYIAETDSLNTFLFFSAGEQETDNIRHGCNSLVERLKRNSPSGMEWNYQVTLNADHQSNSQHSVGRALGLWGKYVSGMKPVSPRL
jgi:predicted alpha/beta superfamily hydrolase